MIESIPPNDTLRTLIPAITDRQIDQLEAFATSLKEWNARYNLISRNDVDHLWEHHILPSLIPISLVEFPEHSFVLDIGSGGGFPAIPLKIVRPDLQMLLVDSVRKKTLFLQKIIADLDLKDVAVQRERIESLQRDPTFRDKFDIITARALANTPQLIEWSKPFLKPTGFMLLWKGRTDIPELERHAAELNLNYDVLIIPDRFKTLSSKFEELCFFKIWF